MDNQAGNNASQLVLDNRRLILAFALLIVVCGGFFVIGFVEGKRQGRAPAQRSTSDAVPSGTEPAEERRADARSDGKAEKAIGEDLDWYKNVNRKGSDPIPGLKPPPRSDTASVANRIETVTPSADAPAPKAPPARASNPTQEQSKVTYSVQVGAFRNKQEADAKAEMLKSKKYKYVMDQSGGPDNLYLLQVGRFESRADAVAMQLRLKKDGFVTFIKTIK